MFKIITPTDFSDNSLAAVSFAAMLANAVEGRLTLLHIVTPAINSPVARGIADDEKVTMINLAVTKLKGQVEQLQTVYPSLKMNYIIHEGETPDSLINKMESEQSDLMVMGTQGTSGLMKNLFGSNTLAVIQYGSFPVLAIPSHTIAEPPREIVFATNYQYSDLIVLEQLIRFARAFHAELNIVHIISSEDLESEEKQVLKRFRELVGSITTYEKITFSVFRDDSTLKGIESYVLARKSDVVAIATRKRGKIKRLFEKSISEQLVKQPAVPLWIFHVNEDITTEDF